MAYTPINFKNKQSGGTAVSAANLNHMEDGIKRAHDLVPTESGSVGQVLTKTASGTSWQDADNLPEGGTEGQVLTRTANDGAEWTDAGNPTASQVATATSAWLDEHITEVPATAPIVDTSLLVSGAAADSQTVGNELSELKSAIEQSGGGGQPVPVTLASAMTDTDKIYLYLGSESGYEYGYIYAYVNSAWTKTRLYGQGQKGADGEDGTDGYSPSVSVASTSTGVTITATDKSGTTTANVSNGTATQAQVDAWLDAHPDATTTVADGSITTAKLESSLQNDILTAKAIPNDIGLETTYEGISSSSVNIQVNKRRAEAGITYTGGKCYSKTTGAVINANKGALYSPFRYKPNSQFRVQDGIHIVFFDNNMKFVSCIDAVTEGEQTVTAPSTDGYIGVSSSTSTGIYYVNTYAKWVYTDFLVTKTDHSISALVNWDRVYNREYVDTALDKTELLSTAFHVYSINVADGEIHPIEFGKTYASNPYIVYGTDQADGVVTFYNANYEIIPNPSISGSGGNMTVGGWRIVNGAITIKAGTRFTISENVITSYHVYASPQNNTVTLAETPAYIKIVSTTKWTVGQFTAEVPDGKVNCTYDDENSTGFIEDISDSLASNIIGDAGNMSALMKASCITTVNRMRHAWRIGSFNINLRTNWSALKTMLQNHGLDMIGFQEVNKPITNSFEQGLTGWALSKYAITETEDSPGNCRPVATSGDFTILGQTEVKYTQQTNYGHRHYTRTEIQLPKWKDKKWSEYLKLSFYNTQLEVGTSSAYTAVRVSQANELITAMKADPNPFIVLTGDFNEMSPNFSTRQAFIDAGFIPAFADESTCTVAGTSRGYYDNIYINDRISFIDTDVIPNDALSDHDLVLADILPDYTNIITVKKNDTQNHCTISGVENWLDRRQTEPVTVTITPDSGYTFKSVTMYQGDNDVNYGTNPFVISGNTVTIYPNRVVGDIIISPTCEASS